MLVGASNEADLIEKSRSGDHTAYVSLIQLHDAHLRRFVFNSFGSTAIMDTVLEEVYHDAYGALRSEIDEPPFGTWLYRRVFEACEETRDELPNDYAERLDSELATTLLEMPLDHVAAISMVAGEMVDENQAATLLGTEPKPFKKMVSSARSALEELDLSDADTLITSYRPARHDQDFWVAVCRSFGPADPPTIEGKSLKRSSDAEVAESSRRWIPRMSGLLAVVAVFVIAIVAITSMFGGADDEAESGDEGSAPAPIVLIVDA